MRYASLLFTIVALGCSSAIVLTDEGQTVQRVTDAEKPGGCRLLGDVAIGVPPDAARPRTEEELFVLMRNKAGEADGTHVVVDSTEQRDASTERPYWVGRGRSYACPEEQRAPAEEGTAGGESPAEGGGDEAAEGEGGGAGEEAPERSSEEDAMMEDLLGD
jgi:hypothetical protein